MKRTWLILNTKEYDYMIQCRNFNQINILNAESQRRREKNV